jgi:hypothetical protein
LLPARRAGGQHRPSDEQIQADIARAIMAVECYEPIEGTSSEEWEAAIAKAEESRIFESESEENVKQSGARIQADIYRTQLNVIRGENISMEDWKSTYEGNFFGTHVRGVKLLTTPKEFADAPVPEDRNGHRDLGKMMVKVSRGDVVETKRLCHIMSGATKLLSATEKADVKAAMIKILKENNPKGSINTNTKELVAIKALNTRLELTDFLEYKDGIESRKKDGFSRVIDNTEETEKKYVAEQVKASGVRNGSGNFNSTVGKFLPILLDGGSVVCIVMDKTWSVPLVVWYLHGEEAIEMLEKFDKSQRIQPVISPKKSSEHAFYIEFQSKKFRYNISDPAECKRLRDAKIEFAKNVNSRRETYEFWNCDKSQMSPCNYKEQLIINAMNEKLQVFNVFAKKHVEDNYSKVDVRVILPNGTYSRVQSKMVTIREGNRTDFFHMCKKGGKPINLRVQIDGLDIYNATSNGVFSLPARVINPKTGKIEPYLSKEEMSKTTVTMTDPWRDLHMKYFCDLNDEAGVKKYIAFQKERILNRPQ